MDRSIGGPDSTFSMNEMEFKEMVKSVREAEIAFGKVDYNLSNIQIKGKLFSRSLYFVQNIKSGDIITEKNVKSIRPGFGLHPKFLKDVLGKKYIKDAEKGDRLLIENIIMK